MVLRRGGRAEAESGGGLLGVFDDGDHRFGTDVDRAILAGKLDKFELIGDFEGIDGLTYRQLDGDVAPVHETYCCHAGILDD